MKLGVGGVALTPSLIPSPPRRGRGEACLPAGRGEGAIPPIDLAAEFREISGDLRPRLDRIFKSGRYILGEEVAQFERDFARFIGTRFAIAVASGSDAILLGLMALGVKPGDEVITTPFTFISTATSIVRLGAKPVFVDIEPDTFNLNPALIKSKITKRTRGIIPVHFYGMPCRIDEIKRVANRHGLFIIEDCAQACGALFKGKKVGSFGTIGAFSFYPTKTLGAMGDAGAITVNDRKLYQRLKSLHLHGEDGKFHSYRHPAIGINSRMDAIQAAGLNVKLKYLNQWNRARRRAAARYTQLITKKGTGINYLPVPFLELPTEPAGVQSVFHQYTVRAKSRDQLFAYLKAKGIGASVYYPIALHLQPCFRFLGYRKGDFPEAELASREVISIPLYPQIILKQQKDVVQAIRAFYS